jgi:hypothetical protein
VAVITSLTTLETAVTDYLARSNLSTFVPNFVQAWEEDFYREPKNFGRWMEVALSSVIASSVIAVPSDYMALKYAYVNGSPASRLDRVSLNQLYGAYPRGGDTGIPRWIARDVSSFVFGPAPDSGYTIKGTYWGKPTNLRSAATDASAHYMIVNAPDVCLFGSLLQAVPFIKDDARIAVWQGMHDRALQSYRRLQRDEEQSGSPSQEVLA